jgi:hypothetical protein
MSSGRNEREDTPAQHVLGARVVPSGGSLPTGGEAMSGGTTTRHTLPRHLPVPSDGRLRGGVPDHVQSEVPPASRAARVAIALTPSSVVPPVTET